MPRDKEKLRAAQRRYMHEKKDWLGEFKKRPCMDCKNIFPTECMDFDHRPGEIKKFNINSSYNRNKKDLLKEIQKCDIICSNCHRIRTKSRIILLPWVKG